MFRFKCAHNGSLSIAYHYKYNYNKRVCQISTSHNKNNINTIFRFISLSEIYLHKSIPFERNFVIFKHRGERHQSVLCIGLGGVEIVVICAKYSLIRLFFIFFWKCFLCVLPYNLMHDVENVSFVTEKRFEQQVT